MSRNVEIKALRKRVVEVSAPGSELLVQRDTFYAVLHGFLKLRESDDGTAELIYYERPDKAGPKTSKYTRGKISDAPSMRELLGQVLKTKTVVAKRREVFLAGRTRIHLDQVDDLGTFIELEVALADDEADSVGERIASVLMEQLGVHQEDLIEKAYVELMGD